MDHLTDELPLEHLAAIGAVTLNFAALETTLDFTVAMIFNGIDKMGDDQIPRSLDNKLGFLRKAFKHPSLAQLKDAANKVLDDVHNIKELRHDAIHGALIGTGFDVIRVRYTPQKHVTQVKPAPTTAQLEKLALRIRGLFEAALAVSFDCCNIAMPENPIENPFH